MNPSTEWSATRNHQEENNLSWDEIMSIYSWRNGSNRTSPTTPSSMSNTDKLSQSCKIDNATKHRQEQQRKLRESGEMNTVSWTALTVTRKSRKNHFQSESGVYRSLRPIIVMAMCLGMMPMSNVTSRNSLGLGFHWRLPQTAATVVFFICLAASSATAAYFYAVTPASSWNIEEMAIRPRETVFYASCAAFVLLSLRTARRLPDLLRQWDEAAERLRKYVSFVQKTDPRCHLHLSVFSAILFSTLIMSSAVIEHTLHDVTIWYKLCNNSTLSFWECYYIRGNDYFAHALAYTSPVSVAVFIFNKFATFAWNFQDLLIILLSLALRTNFNAIVQYLKVTCGEKKTKNEWMILREDHSSLAYVVEKLDTVISPTVLVSYAVNVYFLCIQIFYAIRPCTRTPVETVYFYASFFHLLFRTCAVSFAAASFYDKAMEPLQYLHRCPSNSYCEEVHRLVCQISLSPAAFTGCKFFIINRHLFLAITSLILTYELILLNVT